MMSEAHTPSTRSTNSTSTIIRTPTSPSRTSCVGTTTDAGNGKKLKKSPGVGPGSGPRGRTPSNNVPPAELAQRRRSASGDYGELSVRSRNVPRPRSRAEEWVEGQGPHEQHQREASAMETKEEENSALTKKTSAKRRKSDKRRSLPVSSATSSSPSPPSSSSPLPSKPPRAPPAGDAPKKSMSVSVLRTSSIRNATSAPTSSSMSTSTTTTKQTKNQSSNTKSDRRSSAPPVGGSTNGHGRPAEPSGGTSLMSIVEDVAKVNREGWGKVEKEKENIGAGSGLGIGLRVREEEEEGANMSFSKRKQPTSIALEDVRAPRGIDLEDLKEQMERERAEKLEKRGHVLSQSPSTGRPHSGSALAAISRRPTRSVRDTSHLDLGPTTPALAPLADIPVVNNTQTRIPGNAQNEHMRYNPGQVVLPLQSALKNSSQTPSPMLPQSHLQPPPQSQQTSPKGSQMGSSMSTASS
ncbi:uncharacterized protein C8R40DRAFT_709256 [Lentinula edodes]|uniref:uncharacterized protein n=1 Tax=Lentinula edodes TaxID=5353 RepID=UPI001E8CA82F|nr:uncharacterized protein C8R40DRAFT_733590 [Lentinula edodes]XP_046080998.1 uncharacterized protein C8R40DRAFT_709256 [Lentinula edodes]KAH7869466.1 hypothetical protein C8R40DRAFT_733590 [Lentinula edodes]KAH7869904.1 hypothetical protein C8R40DRAFT_709256 [Lentinula edodes]